MTPSFDAPIGRRAMLRRLSLAAGGLATAPLVSGLLAGCRTPADAELADYAYAALGDAQQRSIAALVEQIIPTTDTPGARDAGVPQFIDTMLSGWYAPDERDAFLAGLAAVDARAEGGSFAALAPDAQAALVAAMDAETFGAATDAEPVDDDVAEAAQEGTFAAEQERENEVAGMQGDLGDAQADSTAAGELITGEGTVSLGEGGDGPSFYRQLKELTVAGYYTSEVGATQELDYVVAPGRFDADIPLAEAG